MTNLHATKTCVSCGRRIEWRRKWQRDWDQVKYCSAACRKRGVRDIDERLERAICDLLDQRGPNKTLCPSEAARAVDGQNWRDLMEPARRAARRLVEKGRIVITQKGKPVDPSTARGAIRLKKA